MEAVLDAAQVSVLPSLQLDADEDSADSLHREEEEGDTEERVEADENLAPARVREDVSEPNSRQSGEREVRSS